MNTRILAIYFLFVLSTQALRPNQLRVNYVNPLHQGQQAWYTFNQGPTGNKCKSINDCDGQRTCSIYGWCQGTSRPPKGVNYRYDQGKTGNKCPQTASDKNYANRDYYCDGQRTCSSWGWCQGTSRPQQPARPAKNANYRYDQAKTGNRCPSSTSDPKYATRDYLCDGNRTCSPWGWCQGKSR